MGRRFWFAVMGVGVCLAGAVVAPAAQAVLSAETARTILEQAAPAVGAVLSTVPGVVSLTFDQNLVLGVLSVTGPHGDAGGTAPGVFGNVLSQMLAPGLPAGAYTVSWMARAAGSLPNKGSYTFQILPTESSPTVTPTPAATLHPTPTPITRPLVRPAAAVHAPSPRQSPPRPHPAPSPPAGRSSDPPTTAPPAIPTPPAPIAAHLAVGEPNQVAAPAPTAPGHPRLLYGLIAAAVLLQLGAGLWGLHGWRHTRTTGRPPDTLTPPEAHDSRRYAPVLDPWGEPFHPTRRT